MSFWWCIINYNLITIYHIFFWWSTKHTSFSPSNERDLSLYIPLFMYFEMCNTTIWVRSRLLMLMGLCAVSGCEAHVLSPSGAIVTQWLGTGEIIIRNILNLIPNSSSSSPARAAPPTLPPRVTPAYPSYPWDPSWIVTRCFVNLLWH
jgi:hypothetical protein